MIVTIKNDFHNTECRLRVPRLPYQLSAAQVRRCRRVLCGMPACSCGGGLDQRGPQSVDIEIWGDDSGYNDAIWLVAQKGDE